jgi:hypothetical protein
MSNSLTESAPLLLDALEDAKKLLDMLDPRFTCGSVLETQFAEETAAKIIEAIDKAKGEEVNE